MLKTSDRIVKHNRNLIGVVADVALPNSIIAVVLLPDYGDSVFNCLQVTSTIAPGRNRLASQSIAGPSGTTSRSFTTNGRGDVTVETRDGAGVTANYDAYGRLATYARTGTPSFTMLYSGTDERVQVRVDGTPRRFLHDESGRLIREYGATRTMLAEHVWLMPDNEEGGWEPLALLSEC
jgi:hypothetical protein